MSNFNAIPPADFLSTLLPQTKTKAPDIAQQILINGAVYFNEKLFKVFCPNYSFADKVQLAKKMFEIFLSEIKELAAENITIDRKKYYFELADVMFCAYGLLKMFNLHFEPDADKKIVVYLCNNTNKHTKAGELVKLEKEQYELLKDIADNEITVHWQYAYACAQSNATKFFKTSDEKAMLNNPAKFAQDNNLELHSKDKVCFFTEKLPPELIKSNAPRKVLKFEQFGYKDKDEVLQGVLPF